MIGEYLCGGVWERLPQLLTYRTTHTDGDSADSFEITFPGQPGLVQSLHSCPEIRLKDGQSIWFRGVIDEVETAWGTSCITTVCGRGLAAKLMDNQAGGAEFYQADLRTVLDRYVRPFGITDIYAPGSYRARLWSVGTGVSCFRILQGFCRLSGAPQPRFSREGTLMIAPGRTGYTIHSGQLLSAKLRLCRYGVISRQLVTDLSSGAVRTADLACASRYGISSRHAATRSGPLTHVTEKNARQRLEDSTKELYTLELVLPHVQELQCCDSVKVNLPDIGATGNYIVAEACREFDGSRETSCLRLRRKEL